MKLVQWAAGVAMLVAAAVVQAAHITYEATPIGGDVWRYDYEISNVGGTEDIEEFSIYFSIADYQNLAFPVAPALWDPILVQPDAVLASEGFFDALALSAFAVISIGETLGGFSVAFEYLGPGSPGGQLFEVLDPVTFAVLSSGTTAADLTPPPTGNVPIPSTLAIFSIGAASLLVSRRKRRDA